MFHVKHFYSFSVGVSDQTKTAGVTHLVNVSLRMDTHSIYYAYKIGAEAGGTKYGVIARNDEGK
jgi:hypothetical protein